ncbi:MAG: YhbY family RNA-binding protein [Christensenellales bacterium]
MITTKQRAELKKIAQNLKPALNIGKENLNDNMFVEIDNYLNKNELMKIKILQNSVLNGKDVMKIICEKVGAEPVLTIGKIVIVYKKSNAKNIKHILGE